MARAEDAVCNVYPDFTIFPSALKKTAVRRESNDTADGLLPLPQEAGAAKEARSSRTNNASQTGDK